MNDDVEIMDIHAEWTTPDVWLNLQKRYELQTAQTAMGDAADRIRPTSAST